MERHDVVNGWINVLDASTAAVNSISPLVPQLHNILSDRNVSIIFSNKRFIEYTATHVHRFCNSIIKFFIILKRKAFTFK
jgi:hypothetical protein